MSLDDLDYPTEQYDTPRVEDVTRAPAAMLDPTRQPAPKVCRECGKDLPYVWWPGRHPIAARWTHPKPCESCEFAGKMRDSKREMERRQENSGIAPKHRRHRWAWQQVQERDEGWPTFARRTRATETTGTPRIGVARLDAETARAVSTWEPGHGSMYLHGPVGSGKSLWVAARMADLLVPTEEGEVALSEAELVERGVPESMAPVYVRTGRNLFRKPGGLQTVHPLMVDEEEIVRRVTLAWTADKAPLVGIARADVLVYDDLGSVLVAGAEKARDLARRCVAQLVDLRWREERPMLITSNRPLDDLREYLDARTVDRLHEMVGARQHAMVGVPAAFVKAGWSWRNLPPDEPEAPKVPAERQRRAAGEW